jgi:tyrosyl-DNA phosphodiesterase-1
MKRKASSHEADEPTQKRNKPTIIHVIDDDEDEYDEEEDLQKAIRLSLESEQGSSSTKLKYTGEMVYLNKLHSERQTFSHTLSIHDLLDVENLESATLSTYCLDIDFVKKSLPLHKRCIPITLIKHWSKGTGEDDEKQGRTMLQIGKSPICICHPYLLPAYSNMHAKLMLLGFPGFLRVVVSSANLTSFDWDCYTQSIWVQDFPVKSSASKTPQTSFEKVLLDFWSHLTLKLPSAWLTKYDYSQAKVDLVPSVPGYHTGQQMNQYGHMYLRQLIKNQLPAEDREVLKQNNLYYQISSLGSMNTKWLTEFSLSMGVKYVPDGGKQKTNKSTANQLKIVFPTLQTVANSELGMRAGGMIHLNSKTLSGKEFPRHALCDYENTLKSQLKHLAQKIMVHKSEPTLSRGSVGWLYIGSHNMSMAAWGRLQKQESQLQISNFELGVFFKKIPSNTPIPFKLPAREYTKSDEPFVLDSVIQE